MIMKLSVMEYTVFIQTRNDQSDNNNDPHYNQDELILTVDVSQPSTSSDDWLGQEAKTLTKDILNKYVTKGETLNSVTKLISFYRM